MGSDPRAAPDEDVADDLRPAGAETVLVVRLGEAEFGLPVAAVREVMRTPEISRVPFAPPDVTGLIGVRGTIVPVLDFGLRLLQRPAIRPGAVVVAEEPETLELLGLLVDSVSGLDSSGAEDEERELPAEAEVSLPAGWVTSVRVPEPGRPITILDLRRVLPNVELRATLEAETETPSDSEP